MPLTLEQLGKGVVAAGLATVDELRALFGSLPADQRPRDAEKFAQLLRDKGKLTDYQSQILLQGKGASLAFGNYVLMAQLGVGASGHVFRAKHKLSGREVAIKVLAAEVAKNEKSVKRFHREVQATAKLAHPNIVRAVDAGEFNGQHYMVMEFVAGEDLASTVKTKGPLAPEDAVKCVLDAARALEYAHSKGIVHRDIKPGNLLRDHGGAVRLLDLGLVRFEESGEATGDGLTGTQQVMGTIDYMAPEQVLDTRHADARCDIYSLGCTLFYLITGRKVYEGKGVVDRIMAHRTGAIPSLEKNRNGVSPQLDIVFAKMVAKQPDQRYQKMTEVCRALERFLKGEPVEDAKGTVVHEHDDPTAMYEDGIDEGKEAEIIASVEAAEDVSLTNLPTVERADSPRPGGFAINTVATASRSSRAAAVRTVGAGATPKLNKRLLIGGAIFAAVVLIGVVVWLAMR
jgi:serine/threonine protein kinase